MNSVNSVTFRSQMQHVRHSSQPRPLQTSTSAATMMKFLSSKWSSTTLAHSGSPSSQSPGYSTTNHSQKLHLLPVRQRQCPGCGNNSPNCRHAVDNKAMLKAFWHNQWPIKHEQVGGQVSKQHVDCCACADDNVNGVQTTRYLSYFLVVIQQRLQQHRY